MEIEKEYECFDDVYGNPVMTYASLEAMRQEDKRKPLKNFIAPNKGGQEAMLASNAKIIVFGSARGPGKSFGGILECLYDINDPNFTALILRAEKPDLDSLIEKSKGILKDEGVFIGSDKSLYWDLKSGGRIYFSYHDGDMEKFMQRMQGKERCYVLIDEGTHVSDFEKVLYLTTILRNANGVRCRMIITCNPDSKSFLKQLISWYLGTKETVYEDGEMHPERIGYPIPERDGKRRYVYFAGGANLSEAVWGDTREEVYDKCKEKIDRLFKEEYRQFGDPKDLFIHSFEFYGAKLSDNVKLMQSDPTYLANLANASEEQIARDLEGCWEWESIGDDTLTVADMNRFFDNTPQWDDGVLRAAQDPAFTGGDKAYTWLIKGKHIIDVDVAALNSKEMIEHTKMKLEEWGVKEENFAYDVNGIGQAYRGFFKRAIPFNNLEGPWGATEKDIEIAKKDHDTFKSQCAFALADAIKFGEVSIASYVLEKRVSGKGYENITIRDMLLQERRVFNADERKRDNGKGKCLQSKPDIKRWLKRSPDGTEGLIYLWSHFVKKQNRLYNRPLGAARYVPGRASYSNVRSRKVSGGVGHVRYR